MLCAASPVLTPGGAALRPVHTPQIQSLKNLGLDITRADIGVEGRSAGKNRFFVTDAKTSDKIVLSERLEEIRATIIQNMLMYHPESRDSLAAGRRPGSGVDNQLGARPKPNIETRITIHADPSGSRTSLQLTTTEDRLVVQLSLHDGAAVELSSVLSLRRLDATEATLWRMFWRYPLLTLRVSMGIYRHAAELLAKGVPVVPHPAAAAKKLARRG